uniref:BTB domain-containing protein n=1 Tax=Megaselia scalaris TaxID=36166 RepID=T1GJ61_MEGSC
MLFHSSDHGDNLSAALYALKTKKQFCDITIITDEGELIAAHKNVLSSTCLYFEAMLNGNFKDGASNTVRIRNICYQTLHECINFLYTGDISITEDNVFELLESSVFLQIEWIKEKCCSYLIRIMTVDNCLDILNIAENFSCDNLYQSAFIYVARNFSRIILKPGFLNISLKLVSKAFFICTNFFINILYKFKKNKKIFFIIFYRILN